MATSNNTVVVSRIQNRRGLKQDLPQPLRAGEIGLEDKNGVRILYSKQATNVIPLHRRRAADSDGSA